MSTGEAAKPQVPTSSPMNFIPGAMQMLRPMFSAKKEGITFDGSNPREYQNFVEGWRIVEDHFNQWGQSKICLFRELKRALSGNARYSWACPKYLIGPTLERGLPTVYFFGQKE